LPHLLKIESNY